MHKRVSSVCPFPHHLAYCGALDVRTGWGSHRRFDEFHSQSFRITWLPKQTWLSTLIVIQNPSMRSNHYIIGVSASLHVLGTPTQIFLGIQCKVPEHCGLA